MDNMNQQESVPEVIVSDREEDNNAVLAGGVTESQSKIQNLSEEYFNTLINVFPDMDRNRIRKIISDFEPIKSHQSHEEDINFLIEKILRIDEGFEDFIDDQALAQIIAEHDKELKEDILKQDESLTLAYMLEDEAIKEEQNMLNQRKFEEFLKNDEERLFEKVRELEIIFPNCDPEFLLNIVKQNIDEPERLQLEIEDKLISNNYPTRDNYYKRLKIREKKNTFNIEKFVEKYKNPFIQFENRRRKCSPNDNGLQFLNKRFSYKLEFQVIEDTYVYYSYNLSLTDKHLCCLAPPGEVDITDEEDINLIDELLFIQYKTLIKEYYDRKLREEKAEFETLKVLKQLLECQCCYDEFRSSDCNNCPDGHIFCNECITRQTENAISNGEPFVNCLTECNEKLSLNILKAALNEDTFDKFFQVSQEADLKSAKISGIEYCPFCAKLHVLSSREMLVKCANESCRKITCRQCKRINHLPIKCEDVLNEHTARLRVQEAMSEALIRVCLNCSKPFVKTEGCNHMSCVCGAIMCYICRKPPGQCPNPHSCKNDSRIFDQEIVEQTRRQVREQITRNQPELKIDDL